MPTSVLDGPSSTTGTKQALRCFEAADELQDSGFKPKGWHRSALAYTWDTEARRRRGGDVEHRVTVSPGAIRLTYGRGRGWEADKGPDPVELGKLQRRQATILASLDKLDLEVFWATVDGADPVVFEAYYWGEAWQRRCELVERLDAVRVQLGVVAGKRGRARCREWSRKSKARMVRTLACLDYTRMVATDELVPAMLTLTYPGDWVKVAPTWEDSKRQLRAFRAALERQYGEQSCVWKLETQRRGAPHYHLFVMVPRERLAHRAYRDWCRSTWARIVGASGVDRQRHERAGVSVDCGRGATMSDPQRIAVYFSKHGSAGSSSSKAYQNEAPAAWLDESNGGGGVGRFWGYWRLDKVEVEVIVDELDALAVQRTLRGWVRAQSRTVAREVVRDTRPELGARRVVQVTGELVAARRRRVRRRWTVRSLHGCKPSGFVLANDAPELVRAIARSLTETGDWPPGAVRPLP